MYVCRHFWQLISDAGYQGEITSVSTACHQIEVFSRVLKTSASAFLEEGEQTIDNNLPEFSVSLKNFHLQTLNFYPWFYLVKIGT